MVDHPRGKWGSVEYHLEDFGIDAAERRAFGQPISAFGQIQRHVAELARHPSKAPDQLAVGQAVGSEMAEADGLGGVGDDAEG